MDANAAEAHPSAARPTADAQSERSDEHEHSVEEREEFEAWGYMFKPDKTGTDKLKALLRGLKDTINEHYEPSDNPDLTPTQLASFYRDLDGNYDQLFLGTPGASIAFIYESLGCLHSLQPLPHSVTFTDPTVPALKTEGWIMWQTIQILLGPEEHSKFLMEAVRRWDIKDPNNGEVLPKILPRQCFPASPDKHMVAWYEGVSERLRTEAEEEIRRVENEKEADRSRVRTFFHVSGGASVLVDPLAFRDESVHFQVKDETEVIVDGSGSSKRTGALVRSEATHRHLIPRDTYSGTRLSFETSTLHLNRRKLEYQAGKVTGTAPYVACPNSLYPTLSSPRTKAEFAHIAQNFQLLDGHFAFYFRSVVFPRLAREDLHHLLGEALAKVRKVQHELDEQKEVVLGDLGQFCEDVTRKAFEDMPEFTSTDGSVDARLRYLQDSYLDVPYWCFILELFANEQSKAKESMIRVMSHVKLDSINRRAKLLENAANWAGAEVEDIKKWGPILNGIQARLECLDNVYHSHALDLETSPLLNKLLESRSMSFYNAEVRRIDKVTDQKDAAEAQRTENAGPPMIVTEMQDKSNEVSINIGLIALIVLPSFFFGAYAFHISMASNEPGTFQDADFWNLLQSTIISSSGSLALAIGLFLHERKKIAHWSTAYTIACLIWVVSLICGIVSVAIYTLVNTAWSSMMSTLSGVLALLASLLLILASTPGVGSGKGEKQKIE